MQEEGRYRIDSQPQLNWFLIRLTGKTFCYLQVLLLCSANYYHSFWQVDGQHLWIRILYIYLELEIKFWAI